ncbi:LLM class flavin-dependent oxidoreductase [Microbacterium sp. gxy059]|uniref:LLM class flavin-dependent oxidoreductase n=1 Tax=Microbacterium sp. gxy059 TaxID=2957199 RepID=UPI003D9848B3
MSENATRPTVGVTFRPQSPPEDLREIVRAVEDARAAELWLWEDCFLEGGLSTAAAALAWSEHLRVGLGLMPVPLRNPALAAMEIATLERIAPGRILPGFGHGVLDWMGQIGARVASPLTLLREHVTAVRALLAGERVTTEGRYVTLRDVALDWPPPAAPELLIGGARPKTLRLAGEIGDGVILDSTMSIDALPAARAAVDEGRAAAGRPGRSRVVVYAEVDTQQDALAARIEDRVGALAEAGADAVVLHGTGAHPDPRPHLDALPDWARR